MPYVTRPKAGANNRFNGITVVVEISTIHRIRLKKFSSTGIH